MKTVIEMALEIADQCTRRTPPTWTHEFAMTCIASMVESARAEEREACAMVCEDLPAPERMSLDSESFYECVTLDCADAIRARSNT